MNPTIPADAVISQNMRNWRFLGSKDRVFIIDLVYAILRHQAQLDWWLHPYTTPTPRWRLFVWLCLHDRCGLRAIHALADGERHSISPLTQNEETVLTTIAAYQSLDHEGQPLWVRYNYPAWLHPAFEKDYGDRLSSEAPAWILPSFTDIRVNTLKTTRDDLQKRLAAQDDIESVPTPYSPWGLRLAKRYALAATKSYQEGWFDIQDEGSQLVALLCDAKPGQWVMDYCAGAGGKTLALAAMMQNKGRIIACDILESRLKAGAKRFQRAGVHNYQHHTLVEGKDRWLIRHQQKFDRVLVDAPCSGTGTWRRNPDMKWRLQPEDLVELNHKQATILDQAAELVKPEGLLIYATCSLLSQENEAIVDQFLKTHPAFSLMPFSGQWQTLTGIEPPCPDPYLRLTPHQHHTDGFFAALLVYTKHTQKPEKK